MCTASTYKQLGGSTYILLKLRRSNLKWFLYKIRSAYSSLLGLGFPNSKWGTTLTPRRSAVFFSFTTQWSPGWCGKCRYRAKVTCLNCCLCFQDSCPEWSVWSIYLHGHVHDELAILYQDIDWRTIARSTMPHRWESLIPNLIQLQAPKVHMFWFDGAYLKEIKLLSTCWSSLFVGQVFIGIVVASDLVMVSYSTACCTYWLQLHI